MKVLITGVAGLIGSRLAAHLLSKGIEVYGVDNMSGGYKENVPKNITKFYLGDCENNSVIDWIMKEHGITHVYHSAAYAAEGLSPFIRKYNYTNNLLATANIVNNCVKNDIKRLIFFSSMAVYGNGKAPFDESAIPSPIDPYGIAKYAAEMDIQAAGEQHGLDWCIIRPHNIYGINQNIWDKYRNVLGIWMYQNINDQLMTIFGDGEQKRAFSYIDDILEPLYAAAISPNASKEIINLGGIHETSINNACQTLIRVIGSGGFTHLEQRHEVKEAWSTYKKSEDILGFSHKTSLEDGLAQMWSWAKKQPNRERFVWKNYELDKGLYKFWKG